MYGGMRMTLKFTDDFDTLKSKLSTLGDNWDESQPNKKILRKDGGILNWFESTGSLQFQGKSGPKEKLKKIVANILYPDEFQEKPSEEDEPVIEEVIEPKAEASEGSSIEFQYLTSGVTESEMVIGIVSAVGTESKRVIDPLRDRIIGFGYTVEEIRVSSILKKPEGENITEYDRIRHYVAEGDKIRASSQNYAILAAGAAQCISKKRQAHPGTKKIAYIINSLKHPDEVEFLRKIYGNGFSLFGIHSDEKRRHDYLTKDKNCTHKQANELIRIDEYEKDKHGQKTRDTYHLSDFFVNLGKNDDQVKNTIQRFLELIFSNPYKNPTFDEFAMFMAFNSSVRSSDLSRQVGAVITRDDQIIATGANECPKFGGGLYWAEVDPETGDVKDQADGKDYMREEDSNKRAQLEIIEEITEAMISSELIETGQKEKVNNLLNDSKISDLTEFGRVVHAEMEAMLSCARAGISTVDATLYCTTFPCHNCAKHIIDAGIKRVVYVEPYPKSRALEFHSESTCLKTQPEEKIPENLVPFEPFTGVGARRFLDLFSMSLGSGLKLRRKSKEEGNILDWSKEKADIRTPLLQKSYLEIEKAASEIWDNVTSEERE